jgi:DNA-directed RNA polymerase specialized sigma24 family protein
VLAAETPEEPPERLGRALAAVRSLSAADRSLVRLRLVHDLPYDEIARRTGKTELALRVAFYRIKNKIRKKI